MLTKQLLLISPVPLAPGNHQSNLFSWICLLLWTELCPSPMKFICWISTPYVTPLDIVPLRKWLRLNETRKVKSWSDRTGDFIKDEKRPVLFLPCDGTVSRGPPVSPTRARPCCHQDGAQHHSEKMCFYRLNHPASCILLYQPKLTKTPILDIHVNMVTQYVTPSFIWHVIRVHPCWSMYQHIIPLYRWIYSIVWIPRLLMYLSGDGYLCCFNYFVYCD